MNTYQHTHTVEGPFPGSAPLESVVEFFRANGYELDGMSDRADRPGERVLLERGGDSGGWWSSNTAHLPTQVEVEWDANELEITYRVEEVGQPLTESDRKFWRREMLAAANRARNPSRRPVDLRHEASKRAEHVRRRILSYSIWVVLALMIFVVTVTLFTNGGSP